MMEKNFEKDTQKKRGKGQKKSGEKDAPTKTGKQKSADK